MQIVCPISSSCGGCTQIGEPYEQQLAAKQRFIEDLFTPLLSSSCSDVIHPILGMDSPVRFRNKIVSPFAPVGKKPSLRSMARTGRSGKIALRKNDIACGMYAAGTHKIIECENCPVEHPVGRQIVEAVRQIMARYGVMPYNEDVGTGFMRHVVVRVGAQSGEVLVTLVTNGREFIGAKNFCRELVKRVPEITTIVQNVNTRQTNAIFGQEEQVLYGPGFILDTLCGLSFRISSNSFFQVNAVQTQVLYSTAINMALDAEESARVSLVPEMAPLAEAKPTSVGELPQKASDWVPAGPAASAFSSLARTTKLIDAYCGTGTIGLVAAAAAPGAQVIGVDSVEAAIVDARQNAVHNGIENARFVAQDAGDFMQGYADLGETVDVLFMDPPRAGASVEFLQALLKLAPQRIVYISCNPETQVRDARVLQEGGYRIEAVQPVDMFPHTNHIECVTLMSRTDG